MQGQIWKNIQTQQASSSQPSIWDPALGLSQDQGAGLSRSRRNMVEKERRGQCRAVAFQSGGRVGKLLGDKST